MSELCTQLFSDPLHINDKEMDDFLPRLHDGCYYLLIAVVDTDIIATHIQVHSLVAEFFG